MVNIGHGLRSRKARNHNMVTYAWACQFLIIKNGYTMADLGAGRGDGAMIMSHFTKSIDLYDGHEGQLQLSKRHPYFCPTEYILMDLEKDAPTKEYDVIICFETLEHLKNPERLVREVSKKCKLFIFSIPHNSPTTHKRHYHRKWHQVHKQIYRNEDDVKKMLGDNFDEVTLYQERSGKIRKGKFKVPHRYIGVCKNN